MAYRRSLTTSARLLTRQRFAPSLSCTHHKDDRENSHPDEKVSTFLQSRSFGCFGNNTNTSLGFGGMSFGDPKRSQFLHVPMTTSGFLLARNMSTTNGGADGEEKIECMSDVVADKAMEVMSSHEAAVVSEVAVAAADSWPPVAALQYLIDGIHMYTGLNWWASIVITTLVIRTLLVPIQINHLKASSKFNSLKPKLEQIKQEMQDKGMSPTDTDVAEFKEGMKRLFKEHGVSQFTPFKGLFIQSSVFASFFFAIQNMVEKVPSLQTGGISWFIDLTTPDSFYILPLLTAFSYLVTIESNKLKGYEGNPGAVTMKNVLRGLCALMIPITASFPNALLCCWITSNFFSLVYLQVIKKPSVKKRLNITIREPPSSSSTSRLKLEESINVLKSMQLQMQRDKGKEIQSPTSPTKV